MICEEIGINEHLERNGIQPVETDLGEYIIQLRHEPPSHIIAPAFHLNREDWEAQFRMSHTDLPADRVFAERRDILTEARAKLRARFLAADVGITGANFLIAETGSSVIVTNEGNGDLTQTLPRVHIVLASIEKVVPTLEDCTVAAAPAGALGDRAGFLRLHDVLAPARAGRAIWTGRRNTTSCWSTTAAPAMLGTEFQDMLRCIRCAACMNHCPVYGAIGGHAYGWVYPGPMGSVLTPALIGVDQAGHLPNASTFCGKCESVCPVKIPLPKLMRHWREREFERHLTPAPCAAISASGPGSPAAPPPTALATRAGGAGAGLARAAARPLHLAAASPAAGRRGATCPRRKATPSSPATPATQRRGARR